MFDISKTRFAATLLHLICNQKRISFLGKYFLKCTCMSRYLYCKWNIVLHDYKEKCKTFLHLMMSHTF